MRSLFFFPISIHISNFLVKVFLFCWLSVFIFSTALFAQTPTVSPSPAVSSCRLSGFILEKGFKVPVEGASLFIEPLANSPIHIDATGAAPDSIYDPTPAPSPTATPGSFSANTDLKGYYQVSVPPGDYRLTVTGLGFKRQTIARWAVNGDMRKDFYLEREGFTLSEVVVTTQKSDPAQVSHEVLSHEELTSVAGTMGGDVLRALQALPGVVNAGTYNGQLLVRGSGPDDNLYLVDRVPISFPYHFGVISTLDSNLVQDIDFSAGGFDASDVGVMGGLINVDQRDPRLDRWGFRADVNTALTELEAEGPLSSNSSLAFAGRRSYLELFSGVLEGNGFTSVPVFEDYQVKYSYNPSPREHWDFVALGSDDSFDYNIPATITLQDPIETGNDHYHQGYNSQGVNYRLTDETGGTFQNTLYHYNFFYNENLNSSLYDNSTIDDFGDWFSFQYDFDPDTQLEAGAQYDHAANRVNALLPVLPTDGNVPPLSLLPLISSNGASSFDEAGAYFNQKFKIIDKKLELSAGVRADYFSNNHEAVVAPRVSGAYLLSGNTTVNASYGYYYEPPNRPEYGYYLDPGFGNPDLGPEESRAAVLGLDQKLEQGLLFRVEGFDKELSQLFVNDPATNYSNDGTGTSRGIEFFLRKAPTERFFGWISYTLSDSRRQDGPGQPTYLYDYDEPNVLTAVANYKLDPQWEAGVKWTYNTGNPYTIESSGGSTIVSEYGQPATLYVGQFGTLNAQRLPDYERLDFSLSWTQVYNTWVWRNYLDIFNFFNNENILGYTYNDDYTQATPYKDISRLIYFGTEVKF